MLIKEYASFLNYEIFQLIVDKYQLDNGQEEFKYPDHLKAYVNEHKISEFVEINPLLKDFTDSSKEVILKIDIVATSRLAKIKNLGTKFAEILHVNPITLRLLDIKEGCVVVTFLIPTPVAKIVFNKYTTLTERQIQDFKTLAILWMKCNGCYFFFKEQHTNKLTIAEFASLYEKSFPVKFTVCKGFYSQNDDLKLSKGYQFHAHSLKQSTAVSIIYDSGIQETFQLLPQLLSDFCLIP